MTTAAISAPAAPRVSRKTVALSALIIGAVLAFFAGYAVAIDLTALAAVGGPLAEALTQLQDLGPGMRALVGFIAFVVAFITLAALRNMTPILFYVGVLIFGAVGLPIGGAILGATI